MRRRCFEILPSFAAARGQVRQKNHPLRQSYRTEFPRRPWISFSGFLIFSHARPLAGAEHPRNTGRRSSQLQSRLSPNLPRLASPSPRPLVVRQDLCRCLCQCDTPRQPAQHTLFSVPAAPSLEQVSKPPGQTALWRNFDGLRLIRTDRSYLGYPTALACFPTILHNQTS